MGLFPEGMPPVPTKEEILAIHASIADLEDMLAGDGRHSDHERKQIGRCVYCSCGARAQGKMSN